MLDLKDKLIVALDVDTLDKAEEIVDALREKVKFYKIGSQLFTAYGPMAVKMVAKKGGEVFLDLKFYDIPRTVFAAVDSATASSVRIAEKRAFPVFMMTVHIEGELEMLKKAAEAALKKAGELNRRKPFIVGVTRLTSKEASEEDVLSAARIAKEAGLDGVVCSVLEAKRIREELGEEFIIVTPGIRPKGYPVDDQKRVATAKEAIDAGVNYIVVGKPIVQAVNPLEALDEISKE